MTGSIGNLGSTKQPVSKPINIHQVGKATIAFFVFSNEKPFLTMVKNLSVLIFGVRLSGWPCLGCSVVMVSNLMIFFTQRQPISKGTNNHLPSVLLPGIILRDR